MEIIELKRKPADWDNEEWSVMMSLAQRRHNIGRICDYLSTISESGNPAFSLFSKSSGDSVLNICRGKNGFGYIVFGPDRQTAFIQSLSELEQGFVMLDKNYRPKIYVDQK